MRFGYQQASHSFRGKNTFTPLAEIARECEDHGYDSFWIMDHLAQISFVGKKSEPILEPYAALGGIAALTDKIKIGTLCTCNVFRPPTLVAKLGATVDHASGGRFWLGIGAGWSRDEAFMYGYDFPPVRERLEMLEESLQIIRGAWTKRRFSFRGKYYVAEDMICEPKPLQKPRPPILVGGDGKEGILKLVAKYADACNVTTKGSELDEELHALEEHCKNFGRSYSSVLKTKLASVFFGEDVDSALKKSLAHKPRGMPRERFWSSALAGSSRNIIREIEEYERQGIDYLIINFRGEYSPKSKQDFARNVMSAF